MAIVKKTGNPVAKPYDISPAGRNIENIPFKKLFENSQDGLSLLDRNLKIIYRSASAERINGWNEKDHVRYAMDELVHPDDLKTVTALLRKVLVNSEFSGTCVFRSKHFNGHFIWLESTFTNFLNDPDIKAIVCNFRDVTSKKQDDDLLQQTMKELFAYKYALDEASIVAITDQKGIIRHVNENFCRISKYSAAELIGHDHRIINSGYHDKAFIRNLWVTIARGDIWKGELKNKAKDGSYYWVDTTIIPFLNEHGKPYQYVAIRSDITERKLSQQRIIESEQFIKTITDNLPALIAYWSADLHCLFANKPYMEWFEKKPHEMLGINKRHLLDKDEFKLHESHIEGVLKGIPQRFERNFHRADGRTIDTDTQYLPDKEGDSIKGFYSLIYDISAIKLSEIEVRRKTEQIENILESITDGFLSINRDMVYTYGNKRIEEIFGVPVPLILGKTPLQIFPGAAETSTYRSIKKALQEKINVFNEDYYAPLDLWLENRIFPSGDGVSIFIRDITRQKQQEQHKKELEELLNKATTLARIGSWEVNFTKERMYWSDITREIHETEPDFVPNIETATNFYKEGESREIVVKMMENAVRNGIPSDEELQIVTAKGNIKWVRVIVEAEFADSQCSRLYGSFQDIDARKRAEIAGVHALEERNIILESIDDAFFAVDKNWIVTYWNNMAVKVLGVARDKILNNDLWQVFSDSIDSESYRKYNEALKTNQAVHFEDYYAPVNKWYEISAYPSDTGLSVYFKDITERKTSEMRLKELNENLQKHARELAISNAELEQFAYVASHDLQEPLRMVTSFMTQLEKKYGDVVDDKGRQYIHFAVDGARRMRHIILDLLEFSRVGRTEDDLEDVNFNKQINEILALYRRQIEELQAQVIFENLPVFQTYKTPIRQIFQNLVSNSLKYHAVDTPPVIIISCNETKTHYQFSVKDNGIGIAPEYFDKIFIIFQRLHNKDEYSGTGMGLAITKKIIENLGGKIWVESEEGKGSTFYFTLLKTNKA
jgi:PAS domain S-box-containing protein